MESAFKVFVVDDDPAVRSIICAILEPDYPVDAFESAEACAAQLETTHPDLILLDINLPDDDGFSLLREIRRQSEVGVIMVTGKGEEVDRIVALELGADDYVVKPFNMRELFARAKNLLRRTLALRKLRQDEPVIQFAGWTLNVPRRTLLSPSNEDVRLTQFEFELLLTLARNPGCVLSRDSLIDRVGGRDRAPNDRTIDVLVGRIRRKIEAEPKDPRIIVTVQGVGYVLAA